MCFNENKLLPKKERKIPFRTVEQNTAMQKSIEYFTAEQQDQGKLPSFLISERSSSINRFSGIRLMIFP